MNVELAPGTTNAKDVPANATLGSVTLLAELVELCVCEKGGVDLCTPLNLLMQA